MRRLVGALLSHPSLIRPVHLECADLSALLSFGAVARHQGGRSRQFFPSPIGRGARGEGLSATTSSHPTLLHRGRELPTSPTTNLSRQTLSALSSVTRVRRHATNLVRHTTNAVRPSADSAKMPEMQFDPPKKSSDTSQISFDIRRRINDTSHMSSDMRRVSPDIREMSPASV